MFRFIMVFFTLLNLLPVIAQQKFSVSFYGGYSLPLSDLKGDFPALSAGEKINFSSHPNYLTKEGFNFGANFKYTYDSSANGRLTAGIQTGSFSGRGEYSNLTYKNRLNITTIYGGIEYIINPVSRYKAFIGAELTANFYSGRVEASGDTNFATNRKSETRYGLAIGTGVDIVISKSISLTLGAKYSMANMLGRATESSTNASISDIPGDPQPFELKEIPLNDAETATNKSKSIHYIQLSIGFCYNFGGRAK